MNTMKQGRRGIRRQLAIVGIATVLLLMVPLVAMQFTAEVNWSPFDFLAMGVLLFGSGLTYVLIARRSDSVAYRAAIGVAVAAGLLLMWINLAVGIIGSEDNPANVLYGGVLTVGFVGAGIARFRARGMKRVMYVTALAQAFVPVLAIVIWWPQFRTVAEPPGVAGVLILNGFFAGLFYVSALLFRHASETPPTQNPSHQENI